MAEHTQHLQTLQKIESNNKPAQYSPIISLKKQHAGLKAWLLKVTQFLPTDVPMTCRMYCVLHNITTHPVCTCGKLLKFRTYTIGFSNYCGVKCAANDPGSKKRKQQTCLERYGSTSPLGSKEIQAKGKRTVQEKYGVDNVRKVQAIVDKGKKTCVRKYGAAHPMQNKQVQNKVSTTTKQRYGVSCVLNTPGVLNKNMRRYGAPYYMQTAEFRQKK